MTASTDASTTPKIEQVGGNHYASTGLQHWDLCARYDVPYLLGCASKYPARHRQKKGREDLEKAISYLERYAKARTAGEARYHPERCVPSGVLINWAAAARIDARDLPILHDILCTAQHHVAIEKLRAMVELEYPVNPVYGDEVLRPQDEKYMPDRSDDVAAAAARLANLGRPGTPEDGGHHEPRGFEPGVDVCTPDRELLVLTAGKMTYRLLNRMIVTENVLPRLRINLRQFDYDHRTEPCHRPLYEFDNSASMWIMKPEFAAHWGYDNNPDEPENECL